MTRREARLAQMAATPSEVANPSIKVDAPPVRTPDSSAEDAFAEASRNLRTGADEVPAAPVFVDDEDVAARVSTDHVSRARSRWARKLLPAGATLGIMGMAGMIAVSMTLPSQAVAAGQGVVPASMTSSLVVAPGTKEEATPVEIQAFVASSDVQNEKLAHSDDFSTVSLIDLAGEQGISYSSALFTNDPDAAIQWPFVVGVAMSSGYGPRNGRLHAGIDLVPGAGAPIQAIADGTVRIATESGGNYGVTVYIDHVIDGNVITSHYSHMQYGSLRVAAGETVKVGDIVGQVGNTGRSYGAHLHFELLVGGSTIDPLPWLNANAGRYTY